jgi:hypothetical protein
MQAQIDTLTKAPSTITNGRREDIIAEHLFRALLKSANKINLGMKPAFVKNAGAKQGKRKNPAQP